MLHGSKSRRPSATGSPIRVYVRSVRSQHPVAMWGPLLEHAVLCVVVVWLALCLAYQLGKSRGISQRVMR